MKHSFLFMFLFIFTPFLCHAENDAVRMGSLQNDLHHLPLWVAQEKGLFEKEGVKVDKDIPFRAGPELMNAFKAGSLDMGYVGEAPATIARARDKSAPSVIAQVNTGGSALTVKNDSPIKNIADLKGKRIAIPGNGTVQDFLLRKALEQGGLKPTDVTIIVLSPPEMGPALEKGQIDAFIAWQPFPARSIAGSVGRILADSQDIWPGQPCCVIVATQEMINNGSAKKVAAAHKQAVEFIQKNPEEAIAVAIARTGMDEKVIREAFQKVKYEYEPIIAGEMEYLQFLNNNGYIQVPDSKQFIEDFIIPLNGAE